MASLGVRRYVPPTVSLFKHWPFVIKLVPLLPVPVFRHPKVTTKAQFIIVISSLVTFQDTGDLGGLKIFFCSSKRSP